jgi:tRNA A-37 threonylcarbamoyl transferase component Bud32
MALHDDATQQLPPDYRLDQAILEFLHAQEKGPPLDRARWLKVHSEFTSELRRFLAAFDRLNEIAGPLLSPLHATLADGTGTVQIGEEPGPLAGSVTTPPLIFGDYELIEKLGEGGMGVVYKARQASLNRIVALKMIVAGSHARRSDLARFRAEAEAVAALQHPNIVQIHEVGQRDGVPYLSLEFVPGGTLAHRLNGTPWADSDAARLVQAMARAMDQAHRHGIIHRDLKPGNVLLTADGIPKITDFGLAKRLDASDGPTVSGTILGTPSYMAPEQAGGRSAEIGTLCDVYALGAILYELLTGRPPFRATEPLDTVMQVLHDEPVTPRMLNPNVSRDLETICMKCLRKDRAARYGTALALAEDLDRFLAHEPIHARPIGAMERLWRWCHRSPYRAALVGVVLCALLAAIGTGVWVNEMLRYDLAQTTAAQRRVRSALTRQIAERIDADLRQLSAVPRTMAATLEQRTDWTEAQLDAWMRAELATDPRLFGTAAAFEPFQFEPRTQDFAYYVYSIHGDVRAKRLLPPDYRHYRSWDWYVAPVRAGKAVWSEPFVDEGGGNVPMITCSIPVHRHGKLAGVVTADLSIRYFERLGQWLKDLELPEEDYGFVVSRNGTFLMHPNAAYALPTKITDVPAFTDNAGLSDLSQRLLSTEAGVVEASDPDTGRPSTFYFARVPATGWIVVIVDVEN